MANPSVINPSVAEKRPKQMERGDKINQNIWDLTVTEQVRITPEAIHFGVSACASVPLRKRPCSHTVNEPPVAVGAVERQNSTAPI